MSNPFRLAMLAFALASNLATHAAGPQQRVDMNAIDIKGVGASIGTVEITPAANGGVTLTPNLKGLPPGKHGFHVHEFANCAAREKDGKMSPGEMAGEHYDPQKTHVHQGATGNGHLGDLPPLMVDAQGNAKQAITAPRLAMKDLHRKSLVIHEGADNQSDRPKPNGGGGTRIACGVIGEK